MTLIQSLANTFLRRFPLDALADLVGRIYLDRCIELVWRTVRRDGMRRLHPQEIRAAEHVFGYTFPYEDVRVYENSPFAAFLVSLSNRVHLPQDRGLGVTVFNTIHFSVQLEPDHADIPWLIHEMTHVWQYRQYGPRYLVDALQAQAEFGHGAYEFREGVAQGRPWERFNPEQQADIARAFYKALVQGQDVAEFRPYIGKLRGVAL